jgi:hypothetical protein
MAMSLTNHERLYLTIITLLLLWLLWQQRFQPPAPRKANAKQPLTFPYFVDEEMVS